VHPVQLAGREGVRRRCQCYLEPRKQGGFTVYTREAEAFVDVYPQAGGARVDYYAQKNDGVALQRRAAAATCL